jgi:hypothetical protein
LPGELVIPVNEIRKLRNRTVISEGEETLSTMPVISNPGDLIVDNEDPGFSAGTVQTLSPLKKLLRVKSNNTMEYSELNMWWTPEVWQKTVQSQYYGRYILSSVFTRSGSGDRSVSWSVKVDEPGYYEIYCYIGKSVTQVTVRSSGPAAPSGIGAGEESPYKEMHYKIHHDEGVEEISIDFENAEAGWNSLGRYYISTDTAKVELTNQSSGRVVLGDAIRWVRAE